MKISTDENVLVLKSIISAMPGDSWHDKVFAFAMRMDRSVMTVYSWLTYGPPKHMLELAKLSQAKPTDPA